MEEYEIEARDTEWYEEAEGFSLQTLVGGEGDRRGS